MIKQSFIIACSLFALTGVLGPIPAMADKHDQSPCGKPPALLTKTPLPKEEQEKAKKIRAQGQVANEISEEGDVIDAQVMGASSNEAGRILIDTVKGMKFKPRLGCGSFKTTVNFSLAE